MVAFTCPQNSKLSPTIREGMSGWEFGYVCAVNIFAYLHSLKGWRKNKSTYIYIWVIFMRDEGSQSWWGHSVQPPVATHSHIRARGIKPSFHINVPGNYSWAVHIINIYVNKCQINLSSSSHIFSGFVGEFEVLLPLSMSQCNNTMLQCHTLGWIILLGYIWLVFSLKH